MLEPRFCKHFGPVQHQSAAGTFLSNCSEDKLFSTLESHWWSFLANCSEDKF